MKVETAAVIISMIFFALSMFFAGYFALISMNFAITIQLSTYLALATSFFVAGLVVIIILVVSLIARKLFHES